MSKYILDKDFVTIGKTRTKNTVMGTLTKIGRISLPKKFIMDKQLETKNGYILKWNSQLNILAVIFYDSIDMVEGHLPWTIAKYNKSKNPNEATTFYVDIRPLMERYEIKNEKSNLILDWDEEQEILFLNLENLLNLKTIKETL